MFIFYVRNRNRNSNNSFGWANSNPDNHCDIWCYGSSTCSNSNIYYCIGISVIDICLRRFEG